MGSVTEKSALSPKHPQRARLLQAALQSPRRDNVCAAAEEPGGERCPLLLSREAAAPGVRAARPGEAPWLCLLLLESAFRGRASIRPHAQMEKPRQKVLKRSDPSPPS